MMFISNLLVIILQSAEYMINLSDEELIKLSVRDLNKLLSDLPIDKVKQIKYRRRTLKNRGYASICRERRMSLKDKLLIEKEQILGDASRLSEENQLLRNELKRIQQNMQALVNFKNNHRDELEARAPSQNILERSARHAGLAPNSWRKRVGQ